MAILKPLRNVTAVGDVVYLAATGKYYKIIRHTGQESALLRVDKFGKRMLTHNGEDRHRVFVLSILFNTEMDKVYPQGKME